MCSLVENHHVLMLRKAPGKVGAKPQFAQGARYLGDNHVDLGTRGKSETTQSIYG